MIVLLHITLLTAVRAIYLCKAYYKYVNILVGAGHNMITRIILATVLFLILY